MEPLKINWCIAITYCAILLLPIIIYIFCHIKRNVSLCKKLYNDFRIYNWGTYLKVQITCIFIVGALLMSLAFNGGAPHFTSNTLISRNMSDWGDFATCLTALFALISIFYAYKAFISQVNAARRTSFDATFIQIFSQHSSLRQKVIRHHKFLKIDVDTTDLFTIFWLCYVKLIERNRPVSDFYNIFIKRIGDCPSVDFRNYFKYIYHEISIVIHSEIIDEDTKKRYVKLIQSQMNYDELFCYLINQIDYIKKSFEYCNENIDHQNAIEYAKSLKEYDFFKDLCKEDVYKKHIKNIISQIDKKYISDDRGQILLFAENWLDQ